jgi:hypothetical protein
MLAEIPNWLQVIGVIIAAFLGMVFMETIRIRK